MPVCSEIGGWVMKALGLIVGLFRFSRFPDDFSALTAMHKLNNKMIPNSQPPTKFRLNHTSLGGKQAMDKDFSLWIGDLSPDVDDYTLYKGFASRYPSVRLAKGMLFYSKDRVRRIRSRLANRNFNR
jgi:RNA recognition motif-containing protein